MQRSPTKPAIEVQTEAAEPGVIVAPEIFQPLTSFQLAALDYYRRGLNVFPGKYATKEPYLVRPFFGTRLHVCGPECHRATLETGRRCLPEHAEFTSLFKRASIFCMLGRTSGNLAGADADSHRAYKWLKFELDRLCIPYWSYRSGRGGWFLFRIAEGEAENLPNLKADPDIQIWGHDHYCVLPPSVHPGGEVYAWDGLDPRAELPIGQEPPLISIKDLSFLGAELRRSKVTPIELYGLPEWTRYLSDKNRQTLANPPDEGFRNSALTAAIYDICAAIKADQVTESEAWEVIRAACERCGYPVTHAQKMLNSAWRRRSLTTAKDYYGATNQHNKPFERAQVFAASHNWTGRTALSDRAVFLAMVERAKLENSDTFRASMRELSELAALGLEATNKAVKRLRAAKLITVVWADPRRLTATLYAFTDDVLQPVAPAEGERFHKPYSNTTCLNSVRFTEPRNRQIADVFHGHKAARRLYEGFLALGEGSKLLPLARALGVPKSSASRSAKWLIGRGLLTYNQSEGLYYGETKTEAELERIAAVLGTYGRADRRKRDYRRQRECMLNLKLARLLDK